MVYQWQESEDSVSTSRDSGDHDAHVEKSYSYATDWVDHHIDSSNFANTLGHHNPHLDSWPANSSLQTNPRIKLEGFLLGTDYDVLEVLGGPVEGHGLDGLGCLPSVLEVNSQVGALGLSTLGGIVRLNCVTTHGSVSCRSESSNKSLV